MDRRGRKMEDKGRNRGKDVGNVVREMMLFVVMGYLLFRTPRVAIGRQKLSGDASCSLLLSTSILPH